jgi:WD40 repeat protein
MSNYLNQLTHLDEISTFALSNDMKYIISGCTNGYIYKWDFQKNRLIDVFEKYHTSKIILLSITYNGKYIISVCENGKLCIWCMKTCKIIKESIININLYNDIIIISNDMKYLISSCNGNTQTNNIISVWEIETGNKIYDLDTKIISKMCITSNDKYLLCANYDKTISIISFYTKEIVHEYKLDLDSEYCSYISITDDNKLILLGNASGYAYILNAETGHILHKYYCNIMTHIYFIYIIDNMKYIIVGSGRGELYVFDIETGKIKVNKKIHNKYSETIKLTNDMKYLISSSYDNNIRIWDFEEIINSNKIEK